MRPDRAEAFPADVTAARACAEAGFGDEAGTTELGRLQDSGVPSHAPCPSPARGGAVSRICRGRLAGLALLSFGPGNVRAQPGEPTVTITAGVPRLLTEETLRNRHQAVLGFELSSGNWADPPGTADLAVTGLPEVRIHRVERYDADPRLAAVIIAYNGRHLEFDDTDATLAFTIGAAAHSGTTEITAMIVVPAVPVQDEVRDLSAGGETTEAVTLRWDAPRGNSYRDYFWQHKRSSETGWPYEPGGIYWRPAVTHTTRTTATVAGLAEGTDYDFRVRACRSARHIDANCGAWRTVSHRTMRATTVPPSPPTGGA